MSETITFEGANDREVEVDAKLWNEAKTRSAGRGDGQLGADDASALFAIIAADNSYSELEKRTLKHIRQHYKWTANGDLAFRRLVREAASRGWKDEEVLQTTFEANRRAVRVENEPHADMFLRAKAFLASLTPEASRALLQRTGILDEEGHLAARYVSSGEPVEDAEVARPEPADLGTA